MGVGEKKYIKMSRLSKLSEIMFIYFQSLPANVLCYYSVDSGHYSTESVGNAVKLFETTHYINVQVRVCVFCE